MYVPSKLKRTARRARLSEGHAAAVDFGVELQEVAALLPGDHIGERSDRVGTDARADLALQVVHVVDAVRAVQRDRGRAVFFRKAGHQRQAHLADHVIIRIVGGAEDFRLVEAVPAAAQFVDQRGTDDVRPRGGDVLGAAQVVPLVVAPDRGAGFVRVVEQVPAEELVFAGEGAIDAAQEVLLGGSGAGRGGREIEGSVAGIGERLEGQEGERLFTECRLGNDIADDPDIQRVLQDDGLAGARIHQSAEIAVAHGLGGNDAECARGAGGGVARFPVEEEERLVRAFVDFRNPDRAADVGAELVAVEPRRSDALAGDGIVALRELVVAVELPERAVQPVGAALGDHVDLAAGRAAVFRGVGAGLDLELGTANRRTARSCRSWRRSPSLPCRRCRSGWPCRGSRWRWRLSSRKRHRSGRPSRGRGGR